MGIQELFNWYQKKIGTYDKQLWEKTLEQRIIQGLTHIQTKSAKPKTDLIDLDLVRGSSFTKAKPKHGFITVARLATLRLLFMPLYAKWWVQQTSGKTFFFFLLLYLSEFVNIALYWCNVSKMTAEAQTVPFSEITVPIIMMWVLSFVHSEIVATKSESEHSRPKVKSQRPYRRRRSRGKKVSIGKTLSDDTDVDPNIVKKTHHRRKINWEFDLATEKSDLEAAETIKKDAEPQPVAGSSRHTKRDNDVSRDAPVTPKQPVDDDGFESLNGNGSSPSDNGEPVAAPDKTSQKPLLEESYNLKEECDIRDKEKEHLCNKENFEKCESWVRSLANTGNAKLQRQLSAPNLLQDSSDCESDGSTGDGKRKQKLIARRNSQIPSLSLNSAILDSTCDTDDEAFSSPETGITYPLSTEVANSTSEWLGVTTNSEDCSYSSEYNESDSPMDSACDHLTYDFDLTPTAILSPCCAPSDRVSCTIWEHSEIKKADLSVFDISSVIISKVESTPDTMDYFYIGLSISTVLAVLPALFRFFSNTMENLPLEIANPINDVPDLIFKQPGKSLLVLIDAALGKTVWERTVMVIAALQRWILATIFFFLLAVAEKTFKQRFLYAKLFSHLTSSRRARKSDLPHFRLNKVRNIKTWLSVRSYLKKRGLQRSVDVIVSAAFIISLLLLSFLSMELLKDTVGLHSQYNIEAMIWSIGLGILLLRFMTLGTKINRKYRNLSVLITEQINLYLQIEQKPEKKNELMVANSVLKLAADLLKELESPFKISGLSANPYLYNITKVVILSALSGVLSDMLGFKLKLHKIKVK